MKTRTILWTTGTATLLSGALLWATEGALAPAASTTQLEGIPRDAQVVPARTALDVQEVYALQEDEAASSQPAALQASTGATFAPATVCLDFSTIAKGQYSGFGDYCVGFPETSEAVEIEPDPGSPLPVACYAKCADPHLEAIIRDECIWIDFWEQHTSNVFPPPPAPVVDFDKFVVIAVLSGVRSNGCYGMCIDAITKDSCGIKIHVKERIPCPGDLCTLALTNNYHFVKVCKSLLPCETPIAFDRRNKKVPCSLGIACADVVDQ